MMKKSKFLSAFLAPIAFFTFPTFASNDSVTYTGNTGILETPNARIMPDWSMRFFISQDKPYTYYGFAGTPLPFLESNFHISQLDGVSGFSDSAGYGQYKDKAISFKLLLKNEDKYSPSVVFGGDDIWGTGLYTSKYIAMSKEISYFDFTLGYAKGRLGGEVVKSVNTTNSGSTDNTAFSFMRDLSWGGGKPFGSVLFKATPDLSLVAEYSPINYAYDKINPFLTGDKYDLPDSNINYGLKYSISDNSSINLSYQRGNQISFGYIYQFGFSRTGLYEHDPDPKWKANENAKKSYENLNEKELSDKLSNEIAAEKMSNVRTSVNENKIWAEFDNAKYDEDLKAVGRTISTIDEVAPENYDTIYATLKMRDVPMKTVKVNRKEFDAYENEQVSSDYFKNAVVLTNSVEKMEEEFKNGKEDIYKTDIVGTEKFSYGLSPSLNHYLNDKEKPYALKASAFVYANYDIAPGVFLKARVFQPFYNTIKDIKNKGGLEDSGTEENKLSINSGMLKYTQYNDTQLANLTVDYLFRAPYETLGKVEVGYLGPAFMGSDLEWYKSFFDDSFGLGVQYQYLYKRPVDDMFSIYEDLTYEAKFVNAYMLLSDKYNIHLGVKAGEFLAGDRGVRVDLARTYRGFTVGAYATVTNSNEVFTSEENRNYIDKGIYISMPIDTISKQSFKGSLNYSISPWTRDVGQFAGGSMSLYPMNNTENNIQLMKNNINKILE
ncbi:MAG: YjbH domain-containing protein [Aliarcobacter sp.]|nr:YjbH domain-containing protein [Aliarcobacter sp.]